MRYLFLALVLCGVLSAAAQDSTGISATVYQTANVRSGPDTRFEIVGQLAQGDSVLVTGRDEEGRWLQVTLPSGDVGWLPLFVLTLEGEVDDIPLVDEEPGNSGTEEEVTIVAYGRVNVRRQPAIGGSIVGQLDVGDEARATARNNNRNDWLLIETEAVEGWVAFFAVRVQGDLESLPILVPDSSGEDLIPPSVLIRTRFNARLHPVPELDSPTTVIVPFNSEVTPIFRSDDGRWLLVGYEGQMGWGISELFTVSSDQLEDIPIFIAEATPEAIPEVTPTAERE
jgi:uncharacterized protein YgiM (DUF1202 family)